MNISRYLCLVPLLLLVAAGPAGAGEVHGAAASGDLAAVRSLIEGDSSLLEQRNEAGSTPLHVACENGFVDIARYLVEAGADIGAGDNENSRPIHVAALGGSVEILGMLLELGEQFDVRDDNGMTPLLFTGYRGSADAFRFLVEHGADVNARSDRGSTMVHSAAYGGNLEMLEYLLERGVSADQPPDGYGLTPLAAAAVRCHPDVVRRLAEAGAPIAPAYEGAQQPLLMAVSRDCRAVVELLLDSGLDVNRMVDDHNPLCTAAMMGKLEIVQMLVGRGADLDFKDASGRTPVYYAVESDDPAIVQYLLEQGCRADVPNTEGNTPLMKAADLGKADAVAALLRSGADPTATEKNGWTPLHLAAIGGYADVTELLAASGAKIDVKDAHGMTPMQYACRHGNRGAARCLDTHGARAERDKVAPMPLPELSKRPDEGEAYVWFLNHSGWAVRTKNNLFVFDYWENGRAPDEPRLCNGRIDPAELQGIDVTFFVSHNHGDHYYPGILEWRDELPGARYVFGFRPDGVEDYVYAGPRETVTVGDAVVTTIESNDSGVGFLVEADGMRIFHAGDHANRQRDFSGPYCGEIDRFAATFDRIDVAFLPVSGCGFGDQEAVRLGVYYALEKLEPGVFFPMHGGRRSPRLREYAEEISAKGIAVPVAWAMNPGDLFHVDRERGGRLSVTMRER